VVLAVEAVEPQLPCDGTCTAVEAVSLILTEKPATVGDAFRLVFLFPSFPPAASFLSPVHPEAEGRK